MEIGYFCLAFKADFSSSFFLLPDYQCRMGGDTIALIVLVSFEIAVKRVFFSTSYPMLTQVHTGCLTAKMLSSIKLWLENVYRKQLITSAIRKDLLQIDRTIC